MITLHPKLNPGEKFLGNVGSNKIPEHLKHITGIRLAKPAYNILGEEISDYYAMIADSAAAEEYNRTMERELSAIRMGKNSLLFLLTFGRGCDIVRHEQTFPSRPRFFNLDRAGSAR